MVILVKKIDHIFGTGCHSVQIATTVIVFTHSRQKIVDLCCDFFFISASFYQPRLLYVFTLVCVCVCVRPQISRALSYVIPLLCHYSHDRSGSYWKFAGSIGQGTST